ncbi:hypothetical protein CHELA1G11_13230 [Hyphomicrobiales bacterium]|nr:hypothetical protein CHELA1G2_11082 [Hyphomicrobiales bacterium]CAH1670211.1 hypothetical protein CHELA1G11_13230 [Hyphomicrobiales bacterium]
MGAGHGAVFRERLAFSSYGREKTRYGSKIEGRQKISLRGMFYICKYRTKTSFLVRIVNIEDIYL